MKLLVKRTSQDRQAGFGDKLAGQLKDFLWSLPFALLFSLTWSYVCVHNLRLDFAWGPNFILHLGLLVGGYILTLMPLVSLIAFLIAGGLGLASFLWTSPFLEVIRASLTQLFLAGRNAALWSFEATQAQAVQPDHYPVYVALIACLLALLFIIKRPLPLVLGFFLLLPFFGANADLANDATYVIALLACLASLIFVFVREGKLQDKKQFSPNLPLWMGSSILILTFLVQSFLPQDFFQNKDLADRIRQMQKRMQAPEIVNYYEFSLRDAGYYPMNQNLGGPLQLQHELYMQVTGPPGALRLRGALAEAYTGAAWLGQEMDPNYIFDNLSTHGNQAEVFSYPSVQGSAQEIFNQLYYQAEVRIQPRQLPVQVIFNGGRPQQINEENNPEQIYYYNQSGQIYASHEIQSPYTVQGWLPRELSNKAKFSLLHQAIKDGKLSLSLQAKSQNYRDLAETYDPVLYDILYGQDYQGQEAVLGAFQRLVDHLQENYNYSLDVAYPVPNEDFLANFLRDKEGYCTYFATALALLGRELGLETHYVEGFLVPGVDPQAYLGSTDGGYQRDVLSDAAHAWVEVKFNKLGWYPFDATPADILQGFTNQEGDRDQEPEASEPTKPTESESQTKSTEEMTTPAPQATPPPTQPSQPDQTPPIQQKQASPPWVKSLLAILGLLLALGLAVFFLLKRAKTYWARRQDPQYLLGQVANEGQNVILPQLWEDIKFMYSLAGYSWQVNQTLQQKFAKLDQDIPIPGMSNYPVYLVLERSFYGEEALSTDDLYQIFSYYQGLELELKKRLKKSRWFFKRYLWPAATARF